MAKSKMPVSDIPALPESPLQRWSRAFGELAERLESAKSELRQEQHIGKYADCTVYRVKATTVRSYKRRAFVAVRIRNPRYER